MAKNNSDRVALNEVTHTVRAATLTAQNGVGSMIDFPGQVFMTAAPELWGEDGVREKREGEPIYEPRLAKVLKVDHFALPLELKDGSKRRMAYVRFPEWYFCPECHKLKSLKGWVALDNDLNGNNKTRLEKNPDMIKHLRCAKCNAELAPARIITVCKHGHIDDFPWSAWVHFGNEKSCDEPDLELRATGAGASGIDGMDVVCIGCGARRSLKGVMGENSLKKRFGGSFHCKGRHPWRNSVSFDCMEIPQVMMRGASAVYYPVTRSSLAIPAGQDSAISAIRDMKEYKDGYADFIEWTNKIKEATGNEKLITKFTKRLREDMEDCAEGIAGKVPEDQTVVLELLKKDWMDSTGTSENSFDEAAFREDEYFALMDPQSAGQDEDFICEEPQLSDYGGLKFLKKVVLVHRLREVRAQVGFSRIVPVTGPSDEGFVGIRNGTNWYPGYEVRGEGIFIALSDEEIEAWIAAHPVVKKRAEEVTGRHNTSYFGKNHKRYVSAKYLLLHSFAHLLVRQLSFECGYSIASIRERIYCDEPDEEGHLKPGRTAMSGVLIYTTGGDMLGTLGGLVRQGYPDSLPYVIYQAIKSAKYCSNDPVCSLSHGQGRDGLNLAACHSCMLLPETSCEAFNAFLDRGVILGTMEEQDIGFFRDLMEHGLPMDKPVMAELTVIEDNTDEDIADIVALWDELIYDAKMVKAMERVEKLEKIQSYGLQGIGMPLCDVKLRNEYTKDEFEAYLCWPKQQVLLFDEDQKAAFRMASHVSGWHCYELTEIFDEKEFVGFLR